MFLIAPCYCQVGFAKTTAKAQRAREQRFLPTADDSIASSTADRFELATDTAEVQASHIQYGLSKLAPKVNEGAAAGEEQGSSALSQLMSRQDQETQQMKEDLEKLPEQASMDVRMPAGGRDTEGWNQGGGRPG